MSEETKTEKKASTSGDLFGLLIMLGIIVVLNILLSQFGTIRADLTEDVLDAAERISGRLILETEQKGQVEQRLSQAPDDEKLKAHLSALTKVARYTGTAMAFLPATRRVSTVSLVRFWPEKARGCSALPK